MEIESGDEAAAELTRAASVASAMGLTLVGFAYAHPPRHHTLEASEVACIVQQQQVAVEKEAAAKAAGGAEGKAKELFVGVRCLAAGLDPLGHLCVTRTPALDRLAVAAPSAPFALARCALMASLRLTRLDNPPHTGSFRAVYEDEPIDGDVTAEAYQPTEQAAELVSKGALINCPPGGGEETEGHAALTPESKLEFKIGPKTEASADLSYFVSRVHDLAKPYSPPPYGAFRNAFPIANRGAAPPRKFHMRTFLERQREAGLPFSTSIRDFQMLLHVSGLGMPASMFAKLCEALNVVVSAPRGKVRDAAQANIDAAERWLGDYAGVGEGAAPSASGKKKKR